MRTTTPIRLSLFALGAALAAPAIADSGSGGADPVIVVTGRGLSQTPATPAYDVTEIDTAELDRAASGRLEDALANVAGFQQFRRSDSRSSNPSAQGVSLRALGGNATSRALVLLDGVPMADPFFGYIPFSAIDPGQLARARVTRGGGSSAFGAGAVGGTIELESADAAQLGLVNASALVNDRGETELSGSLAPELGSGFAVVSGRRDRGAGFWTTPLAQRVPASAKARYDSWSTGVRVAAPLTGDVEVQARLLTFADNRTLRFQGADSSSQGSDASLRLVGRGAWQFDALGYVQIRDFSNVVISSTAFKKTLDQRKTPSTGLGGKLELRPPLGAAHVARIGIDWRRSSGGLQEEAYSAVTGLVTARRRAGGRNDDLGLFVQDDWTIGKLVLTAGGRADRWSIDDGYFTEANAAGTITTNTRFAARSGWDTSLRGGAVFRPGRQIALRLTGYTGLRLPTLNELYRPFVVFPVTTRANASLANERLRGFDLGVDFIPAPGVTLSLTAFDNRLRNAIANVTIGTNLRERRNVDAIHARGLEANAAVHLGAFGFDGSLAWTDPKVEASGASAALNGRRPAQTPRIAASGTISWNPCQRCTVAATVRHFGLQFEDDLETGPLPAVTTIDAYAAFPISREVLLILRGENLTDRQIITRNQASSIDLGAPRTVWIGVRIGRR